MLLLNHTIATERGGTIGELAARVTSHARRLTIRTRAVRVHAVITGFIVLLNAITTRAGFA